MRASFSKLSTSESKRALADPIAIRKRIVSTLQSCSSPTWAIYLLESMCTTYHVSYSEWTTLLTDMCQLLLAIPGNDKLLVFECLVKNSANNWPFEWREPLSAILRDCDPVLAKPHLQSLNIKTPFLLS